MPIANSVFDAVHKQPLSIYNRAKMELIISVLFDLKYVVAAPSIIDSPVLLTIFGDFLKIRSEKQAWGICPIDLRVDPVRHLSPGDNNLLVHRVAQAYLSGIAQTGENQMGKGRPFPISHNFAFINERILEKFGREEIVKDLDSSRPQLLERFTPFFSDNAPLLNDYFRRLSGPVGVVGNIFVKKSYSDRIIDDLNKYMDVLTQSNPIKFDGFHSEIKHIMSDLRERGVLTRNQLHKKGQEALGQEIWNKFYAPFLNFHSWQLTAELLQADDCSNLVYDNSVDIDVIRSSVSTQTQNVKLLGQASFDASESADEQDGLYTVSGRLTVPWKEIIDIRTSRTARDLLQKIKGGDAKEAMKSLTAYLRYIAKRCPPVFEIEHVQEERLRIIAYDDENSVPFAINYLKDLSPLMILEAGGIASHAVSTHAASTAAVGALIAGLQELSKQKLTKIIPKQHEFNKWHNIITLEIVSKKS